METTTQQALKGGEFIIKESLAKDIFTPEDFSEEQKMMAEACLDFVEKEIFPNVERMNSLEEGFMPNLLEKAGELGLLGVTLPEKFGGLGMGIQTSLIIADHLSAGGSFSTTYGAHTGIGTLPILYYGTKEQKQQYLPKLATGEWKSSYCLTEPNAGSDANSGKTKAVLTSDGKHYLITGQKMWITNGGFADLFIVFAKIGDDKKLTAFIVEKSFGGITMNEEEKKMGIKGSSTRQIFFNDCKVPVENMLSKRENGFKIAVNILNIGRIKLGVGVVGGAKEVIKLAVKYANQRKQFKKKISSFGAIQYKLAEMATRVYATESASYRVGQYMEDQCNYLTSTGTSLSKAKLKGAEEYAVECAIMKVHGSEVLDYVVDEGVQIYGGMGFSADAPMETAYRDARITRIYEGTSEINRMLLVGMLVRRALKGKIDLLGAAKEVATELTGIPSFSMPDYSELFAAEKDVIKNMKKAILMVLGRAAQVFTTKLKEEQEVLMAISDMIIETYVAESALLRSEKMVASKGEAACEAEVLMAKVYLQRAVQIVNSQGREAISCFAQGDELRVMMMGLKRFTKIEPINMRDARRAIAKKLIEKNEYAF